MRPTPHNLFARQRTRQYPKLRREAAENQFSQLANQHGDLYLDALEDYMISRWPDQNTYELLKLLSPEAVNRLYDGKPITQDVGRFRSRNPCLGRWLLSVCPLMRR